jgi:type 1 fimbria pilin
MTINICLIILYVHDKARYFLKTISKVSFMEKKYYIFPVSLLFISVATTTSASAQQTEINFKGSLESPTCELSILNTAGNVSNIDFGDFVIRQNTEVAWKNSVFQFLHCAHDTVAHVKFTGAESSALPGALAIDDVKGLAIQFSSVRNNNIIFALNHAIDVELKSSSSLDNYLSYRAAVMKTGEKITPGAFTATATAEVTYD